jgi:hypothetical protein
MLLVRARLVGGVYNSFKRPGVQTCTAMPAWYAERDPVLRAEHLDRATTCRRGGYLSTAGANRRRNFETALRLADRGIKLAEDLPRGAS